MSSILPWCRDVVCHHRRILPQRVGITPRFISPATTLATMIRKREKGVNTKWANDSMQPRSHPHCVLQTIAVAWNVDKSVLKVWRDGSTPFSNARRLGFQVTGSSSDRCGCLRGCHTLPFRGGRRGNSPAEVFRHGFEMI